MEFNALQNYGSRKRCYGSGLGRAEECAKRCFKVPLGPVWPVGGFGRPGRGIVQGEAYRRRDIQNTAFMSIGLFEGKLHVFLIIAMFTVAIEVVHGKEIAKADVVIECFMFGVMLKKERELEHLVQRSCIKHYSNN